MPAMKRHYPSAQTMNTLIQPFRRLESNFEHYVRQWPQTADVHAEVCDVLNQGLDMNRTAKLFQMLTIAVLKCNIYPKPDTAALAQNLSDLLGQWLQRDFDPSRNVGIGTLVNLADACRRLKLRPPAEVVDYMEEQTAYMASEMQAFDAKRILMFYADLAIPIQAPQFGTLADAITQSDIKLERPHIADICDASAKLDALSYGALGPLPKRLYEAMVRRSRFNQQVMGQGAELGKADKMLRAAQFWFDGDITQLEGDHKFGLNGHFRSAVLPSLEWPVYRACAKRQVIVVSNTSHHYLSEPCETDGRTYRLNGQALYESFIMHREGGRANILHVPASAYPSSNNKMRRIFGDAAYKPKGIWCLGTDELLRRPRDFELVALPQFPI